MYRKGPQDVISPENSVNRHSKASITQDDNHAINSFIRFIELAQPPTSNLNIMDVRIRVEDVKSPIIWFNMV